MIYAQSAVVPYRRRNGEVEFLFVTSSGGKKWVIPKGLIEHDMTPWESAANEAFEEAGLVGKPSDQLLGTYEYEKWGGTCQVRVYLMKVEQELDEFPEAAVRKRKWVEAAKAPGCVEEPKLKEILEAAAKLVGSQ